MKHKHHIIPRHAGGTDNSDNIIELSIEEHAEAHRQLFLEHGRWQDEIAWKTLAGMIDGQEAHRQKQILGGAMSDNRKYSISKGSKALWNKPGMREHLSKKRQEQHAILGNPMKGKKQKRMSCLKCHKELPVNQLPAHKQKCHKEESVS